MEGTGDVVTVAGHVALAGAAGALAGLVYFGGLYWTVRRLPTTQRPWLLYGTSAVLRLILLLAACYGVLMWLGTLGAAGFLGGALLARVALVLLLGGIGPPTTLPNEREAEQKP